VEDPQARLIALRTENRRRAPPPGTERWLAGYADASYKAEGPAAGGGWGCWVRDRHTRVIRSGPCPPWVCQSNDAELCAVFAAITTALRHLDTDWANIMVIKTDNQSVCRWFGWQNGGLPRKPEQIDLVYRGLAMVTDMDMRLVVTWVKGHRGAVDTKAYLNTQVDRLAGEARQTGRNTFNKHPVEPPMARERAALCADHGS